MRYFPAVLGLVVLVAAPLHGQSKSQDQENRLRNDCRLAAQVITTGNPAPKKTWAYGLIHLCPESGSAMAAAWTQPLAGDDLAQRWHRSTGVRDGRVLLAALAVATSDARSAEERRSALDVVVQLYSPGRTVDGLWNTPVQNRLGLASLYDVSQFDGAQPITASDRTAVLTALDSLGARSATSDISGMAKWLAAELRRMP